MALWKARSLTPEQKVQIIEEESEEAKSLQTEESGTFLGVEDATMSEVYSAVLPVPVISLCLSLLLMLPFSVCCIQICWGTCTCIHLWTFSLFSMVVFMLLF